MQSEEEENPTPIILIVEDDRDFLEFLESEFEDKYQVITAQDGEEGWECANSQIPDLIVSDLMMPRMDGVELCAKVKTAPETSHVPFILLTAKSSTESQLKGLKTGADDYITKPFISEILQVRVDNLLESRKHLRERFSREFKTPGRPKIEQSPDQEFLQSAFDVLEEFATDSEFSAEFFAEKMHISLRTLHRKMKALTGDTPAKLIWNVRLKKAAVLLRESDLRVTEIAFEVGFSESAHFSRMFKQFFGSSPSEYREEG
ncbi:MAG: helix-turn-helix domain-containing protein [Opitutales bacterium]